GLSDREALALWWFQTKMQIEMIAGGMTLRHAFEALGIDQGEMNMQAFHYHSEILRRMKKQDGRGADARGIKGLFKMSREGQDRFQEFLFPTKAQPAWQRTLLGAMIAMADRSDRWLAERAPAT